jgi:uncharacterized hydrophobic protein (TIGR00271 family)
LLRLRVAVDDERKEEMLSSLDRIEGVRRLAVLPEACEGEWVVSADLSPSAADEVLKVFHEHHVPHDDYVILRQEVIAPGLGPSVPANVEEGFAWVEIVGEARAHARPVARYVLLMMVAGVVAGLGVITDNPILIIGAMAVSPDLLPLCAISVGLVGRRFLLARRAFGTLLIGMGLVMVVALVTTLILTNVGLVDKGLDIDLPDLQGLANADYTTVLIAAAAGIAAILAFETRAANAVGVAISVTTVPASAYFGVAVALGEPDQALGAALVLVINLVLLITSGTVTLLLQRHFAPKSHSRHQVEDEYMPQ